MTLRDDQELANTKAKLAELERRYAEAKGRPVGDPHARALSLGSLARLIKQLKEEITLYEIHAAARSRR